MCVAGLTNLYVLLFVGDFLLKRTYNVVCLHIKLHYNIP